jgi:hypothetical protein
LGLIGARLYYAGAYQGESLGLLTKVG